MKLYEYFEKNHADILAQIREKKRIDTALDNEISAAIRAFGPVFKEGLK
jgi:F0F1-type ATP synthase alpha subunit